VRLAPDSAQAWYGYGQFFEKHRKLDDAITQYRQALKVDPHMLDAHLDLATALLSEGNLDEAKPHFEEATRLDPKLAQPHNYLGEVLMRQGKVSEAIPQFETALRLHPDFPEAEENLRLAKENQTQFVSQSPN
jgi:tetratricopeptide (TPR) repeat protein